MIENPFQEPASSTIPAESLAKLVQDLQFIARCHKLGLFLWVMNLLVVMPVVIWWAVPVDIYIHDQYFWGQNVEFWASLVFFILFCPTWLMSILFVAVFATRVFHPALGFLIGTLCVIPGVPLLLIPVVSRGATIHLRMNGIEVGVFGTNLAQIRAVNSVIEDASEAADRTANW